MLLDPGNEALARNTTYAAARHCLATLQVGVGIAQLKRSGMNYEHHHRASRCQSGTELVAHAAARPGSHRIRGSDIRVAGNIPGVGVLTLFAPAITALALLFYIAVWAIATGVLEIVAAIRLRKEIQGEWLPLLAGLASVVFGTLLIWHPGAGALTVLWLIGSYAIVFGVLLLVLAFKIRGFVAKVT